MPYDDDDYRSDGLLIRAWEGFLAGVDWAAWKLQNFFEWCTTWGGDDE